MSKLRLRMHSLSVFHFAITLTVLLISPLSLFLQTSSFSLSLDLDSSKGDQAVQSLDVSPNRDVSIQIFGKGIQTASSISTRLEYDDSQVVYAGFDAGGMLPNPDVRVENDTNPISVQIHIASLDSSATVNSGLVGTIRFRTTDGFSGTTIRLVRAALSRGEQFESMTLAGNVALQVFTAPSPDFDGSGRVDSEDFLMFIEHFWTSRGDEAYRDRFDLDDNGKIGISDFLILTDNFGKTVPVAVGAIDPVTVENDPVTVDVSGNFSDAAALRYTAVSDNESIATVGVDGSEVTIHPVTVGVTTITVTATDANGWRAMQDIAVTVRFALAFATSTIRRALDENTPPGEQIGDPVAVRGFNSLTYRLKGTDADSFAIDARTGQIKTREDISYDFETKNSYWMTVEANDGQGGTASIVVIIKINDVEEPPSSPPSNFWVRPDNESLTVHFSAVSDEEGRPPVKGYHAEIRRGENGPWGTRKTIYGRTNTSVYYRNIDPEGYHSRILVNGQLYQVRVRAYNSEGASEWSAPVSGIPVYTPPKEETKLVQFQGEGDMASADIDLSVSTGEGGRIKVMQAVLPATISQEEVEGIFVEIVEVDVSNAPAVPAPAGFTIPGSSSLFDIELKARVNNRDVAISEGLQAPVEICLPVPAEVSDPVIVHYDEGASVWEMLDRQRVDVDIVCGYTDIFSLFGVGLRVNRAPVAVGTIVTQTLRVDDVGVTVDVSGKFSDPDGDALTYTAASDDEAIATVAVSGSMVKITPIAVGTTTITVTATDAAGSKQTAEQTIAVRVNKASEKLSFGGATVHAQTYTVGVQITELQLPEAAGETGTISYTLTPGLPDGLVLDKGTNRISGTPRVVTEAVAYKWTAMDADKNAIELIFSIVVKLDNQAPVFANISPVSVRENSAGGVVTVSATDADPEDSITGYAIVEGAGDGSQFSIVRETGVLSFNTPPNYEAPTDVEISNPANAAGNNEYIVFVTATGGENARVLTTRGTITVTVTDVDTEAPEKPATPTVAQTTFNSLKITWTAPTNTGPEITAYDVRYILSSADETDDNNWTEVTDAYTSSGDLEYTIDQLPQSTSYDIQVRAKNAEGTSEWSDSVAEMTRANHAPVFTSISTPSVSENSTETIVTVTATDADDEDAITGYAIVDEADGSQFSIVASTGALSFKIAPNYESPTDVEVAAPASSAKDNEYIVIVSVTSGTNARELTARQTITVTVNDVDEAPGKPSAPTVTTSTLNSLKVAWIAPDNTGPSITAYDLRYILSSADETDDNNWTEVTDAWTSSSGGALTYTISALTSNESYDVQVLAKNEEGTGDWSDSVIGLTQANQAPVFSDGTSTSRSFAENTAAGTDIGTAISAADSDGGTLAYSLEGTDADNFDLVTASGQLQTKADETYDYEKKNSYSVAVRVVDGQGGSAAIAVTVMLTDVNEAPVISSNDAFDVVENTTQVGSVVADDVDSDDSITGYEITGGADQAKFSIVPTTGALSFQEAPDFENPTDVASTTPANAAANNEYIVEVTATGGAGNRAMTVAQTITVTVTDANEQPVFAAVSPISVSENITVSVVTVTATDADADDNIEAYEIIADADGSQFEITNGGVLTFTTAPNYEDPIDVEVTDPANDAKNNEYIVVVEATGGADERALTARQTLTVIVSDVDGEAPGVPATPTVASATFNSLKITWTAPTNTGPEIGAYDVRYILSSASAQDKADDSKWTEKEDAWTSGDLEYTIDQLSHSTSYDIQVRSENDEGTGDWSDSVVGMTRANHAPVFTSISAVSVNENSTGTIVTVTATDPDADDNITGYAISGGVDQAKFEIVSTTGALSFKTAPDHENPTDVASTTPANAAANNEYIVEVTATGGTGARTTTAVQTITVTVNDVNEPPSSTPANVQVNPSDGEIEVTWDAATDEAGKPPVTGYQVERRIGESGTWEDQQTASGRTTTSLTYTGLTNGQEYQVWVRTVNDEGHSSWSDTPSGTPNIIVAIGRIPDQTLKVNGGSVDIDLTDYFRYNREASDIEYWAAPKDAAVATETVNGSLMTVTPVGAGSTVITATARYKPTNLRVRQRFTVTVKSANQLPTFSSTSATRSVDEHTPAGENIGASVTATDADGDVLTYSLSGTDANSFDLDTNGQLQTKEGVTYNHEAKSSYSVTVDVDDGFGGTASIAVTITLNDLIEPPSSPPSNVQVAAGNGQLKVTWDAVTDEPGKPPISGYQVERRTGETGSWEDRQTTSSRTTTSLIYKSLTNEQVYYVRVRTINDEGESNWSDTPSGTPIMRATNQAPTFSSTSTTRSVDENTAAGQNIGDPVTATDGDNDPLTYSLSGTDANSFDIVSSSGQLQTKASVTYDYETKNSYSVVVGVNDSQGGTASIAVTITLNDVGEPPSIPPSNVQVASDGDGQLKVTWDAVTDEADRPSISGYQVELRTGKRSAWGNQQTVSGRTTKSFTYTGLTNGQMYQVRVRTVNSDGTSDRLSSSASFLDPSSRLSSTYRQFAQARQNDTEPTLPDFSYAGYHHFSKPVPDVTHPTYDVTTYGAIANDDQSDQDAIVAAIAAAEANGSGIIFFPPGEFLVNTDTDTNADGQFTPIAIRKSNIVLRGSGSRTGGTVIRQVNSMYKRYLSSGGGYHAMFQFRYRGNSKKSTSVTEDATRETFWITVANASLFEEGEWVTLKMESKAAIADFMGGFTPSSNWEISQSKRGVIVEETHRIAEIQNNRMRFHEPLHANINSSYGWEVHEYKFLEEVGVEDISFHGSWTGDFVHHKNYIHDYSWYLLQFRGCVNSWVRRVSFINTSMALSIDGSAISVYHVTIAGNQGHFSFVGNADHSWIGLSEDLAGPQHGPNIQGPRSGNVYYRYDYPASLDFHASKGGEPIATLFDRANGGNLSGSSGVCSRYCPHHLRHFVAYNFRQGPASQHYDFWDDNGRVVIKPIIVGFHGNTATFDANTVQLNESQGSKVEPESLFDAQLELRQGTIPDWLKALRTEWETIRNKSLPNFLPPDRTPPVLTRITLQTEEESAGSYTGKLNLIYNEKLNPVTVVPSDAYAVSIQGVQGATTIEDVRPQRENYLANDRNTVTIDLSWTAQAGTTFTARDVTIDYTPPIHVNVNDSLRVEDYGGNPAGSLMDYILNTAPVFTSETTFTVEENTQSVGTVVAEDGEDSITGYEVSGGADQAQFAITNSGALSFQTAPDHERPADGDTNNEYIVEVTATSGTNDRELTATQTITVTVTDKDNEKPGTPTAPAVSASTLNSLTVTWTVPANTGPAISSYDVRHILSSASEQDKADDSKWTVVSDAWTSGALEHTIENLERDKSYDVQVRATNADGTGDWSDSVAGVTSANQAPVFTSVSAVSVNENSTAVIVTVTATDADADDNITGYAISGGADRDKFSIVSSTGVLSFTTAPDFENPTDVESTTPANDAANNEYIVVVGVTSGTGDRVKTVVQTITVTVTDTNEKPVFADISPISVSENITVSVVTVTATDADTDDDIESYGIVDAADGSQFSITNAGVLTFQDAPNFESPADVEVTTPANNAQNNEYIVVVEVKSGTGDRELATRQTLTVTVSDVDEAPVAGKIYWMDNGTDKIQRANLNGSGGVEDLVTRSEVSGPIDIALDLSGGKMYWADEVKDKIRRADLDGNNITDIITTGLDKPTGIALDLSGNKVYWTDRATRKIQRANLDGTNVENIITTGLTRPTGIALDVSSNKVYWTDPGADKIQRANLDGTNVEPLITSNLTNTMGIALDTAGGKMYWVDNGTDKIQRANLDGTGVEDLVTGVADSRSIALDTAGGKMYWVDNGADKIQRANLDGTNIEDLITKGLRTPVSLALNILSAQTLALTVGTNGTVDVANDFSDPENASLTYTALSSDESIATVTVMGSVVTIAPVASGTATITVTASDGGLSVQQTFQVIVKARATNQAPVFTSASAVSVNENSTSVIVTVTATDADTDDDIESYGIVDAADGSQFSITNAGVLTFQDAPNFESPADIKVTDPANNAKNNEYIVVVEVKSGTGDRELATRQTLTVTVSDVDEAPVAGKIYWMDNGTDKIQRANLNGSGGVEDLVSRPEVNAPTDIALDLSGGKMYWADEGEDKIRRADLDGNNITDIITTGLDKPTGIALDLSGNKVYWTDRATRKIQRANLDGTNVENIITTGLTRPTGIALDVSSNKVYWTDPGADKIQRANLDGTNVEPLITSNLTNTMGIALDTAGGKMYWVDNGTDKIQRANLDGTGVEDLVTGVADSRSIALDTAGGKMYWVDNGADKIQRANLDGTNIEDLITKGLRTPVSLALNILSAQTLALTVGTNGTVDVANDFSDPENASLTYTALSSDESIATVTVMGSVVTIAPVASGTATITVTASDGGLSVQQTFQVIVKARATN